MESTKSGSAESFSVLRNHMWLCRDHYIQRRGLVSNNYVFHRRAFYGVKGLSADSKSYQVLGFCGAMVNLHDVTLDPKWKPFANDAKVICDEQYDSE
ncbi:hypothetical protein LXL04_004561 [Taraxacum kok-saghyz]